MCRITLYKGKPLLIGDLVNNPDNSLLYQSRNAAYHPGVIDESHRRNILVNGDGFGVAWYSENGTKGSCCFKFVTPAWSNGNLRSIGEHVSSHLIFAHIRAASSGHDPHERTAVSNENCHPFKYGKYTFMHNGGIPSFSKVKRKLLNILSERAFHDIKGSTDSEHMFALFLDYVLPLDDSQPDNTLDDDAHHMATAVNKMISTFVNLCAAEGIEEPCSINLCVSDGVNIIATRFRNGPSNPPSLYYNYGTNFVCDDGNFYCKNDTKPANSIVISSAPLSKVSRCTDSTCKNVKPIECSSGRQNTVQELTHTEVSDEHNGNWILMPKDHMLVCKGDLLDAHCVKSIRLQPIVVDTVTSTSSNRAGRNAEVESKGPVAFRPTIGTIVKFRSKL